MYYVYMLRCEDNSIYTGITTDYRRRMKEHFSKSKKCAKYTMRHTAKKLEAVWRTENRIFASKLEYRIKKLPKNRKENLILQKENFTQIFLDELDIEKYERLNMNLL